MDKEKKHEKKLEKEEYSQPVLIKHGTLKDLTANGTGKLGCTKLVV